jgi:serine protease
LFPILSATNSGTTVPATNTYSDSFNISVGTSFSAPMAAGVAALMLSRNPALTPTQVRATMRAAARPFPVVAGVPTCQPPSSTPQDECNCTASTCGAGMLDAQAAVLAVVAPTATQVLPFASPAAPVPGDTITLDGSTSVPGNGLTIPNPTGYKWTMKNSGGIATFTGVSPVIGPTATVLTTTSEGQFTVELEITDSNNVITKKDLLVVVADPVAQQPGNATNPPSGGGGTLSWPWLLALCSAVMALRPRRRL